MGVAVFLSVSKMINVKKTQDTYLDEDTRS
jgi:hypothetical protein